MTSTAHKTATATFTISGAAAKDVKRVCFWDEKRGVFSTDLTLKAGHTGRVAFELVVDKHAALGVQSGTLTVAAKTPDGQFQQCTLSFTLCVVPEHATSASSPPRARAISPEHSPDPSPDRAATPKASPRSRAIPKAVSTPLADAAAFAASVVAGIVRAVVSLT